MQTDGIYKIIYACISLIGGLLVYQLVFFLLKQWVRRQKRTFPYLLTKYIYNPGLYLMITVSVSVGFEFIKAYLSEFWYETLKHGLHILTIVFAGFLLTRIILVVKEMTIRHYKNSNSQDYSLRKAKTKYQLIQRMLNLIVIIATIVVILMTFSSVRRVGTTLLASAGVIGLIIGFAAQKSLGTFFGGIQITITQPIRIDDVVVVDNVSGTISEISLTYVVIDVWDGSRLTVPINYFLENSFRNLTRVSPEMVARIAVYVDYSLPVEEVRKEIFSWLDASDLWDRRKRTVIISAANAQTMVLQASMSVRNSDDAYDLESMLREKLIAYIRTNYPGALPKLRVEEEEDGAMKDKMGEIE
jgi:small-conductance mechanosensitive channel